MDLGRLKELCEEVGGPWPTKPPASVVITEFLTAVPELIARIEELEQKIQSWLAEDPLLNQRFQRNTQVRVECADHF